VDNKICGHHPLNYSVTLEKAVEPFHSYLMSPRTHYNIGHAWFNSYCFILSVASLQYSAVRNNTGRFIMSSVIRNIYNKKTKGPTLMELFTVTGKLNKVHHGWHGTHRYDIQVLATHASTWVYRYSSLLQWSVPLGRVTRGVHIEHL
jgi:hypothetical protein